MSTIYGEGFVADLPKLASVGDTIECDLRHPHQRTLRMKLETPAAAAHANELLADPASGWRMAKPGWLSESFGKFLRGKGYTDEQIAAECKANGLLPPAGVPLPSHHTGQEAQT